MKKSEEINLLSGMIAGIEKELMKDRKDRLQLEAELAILRKELDVLRFPSKSISHKKQNAA